MSDILGPFTQADSHEREVIQSLMSKNHFVVPISQNGGAILTREPQDVPSIYADSNCAQTITGGTIVPVDLISEKVLFDFSQVSVGHVKYIARPDFLFMKRTDDILDIIPFDIKNKKIETGYNSAQLSAVNLAALVSKSSYLKNLISKNSVDSQVVFNNGAYIHMNSSSCISLCGFESALRNYFDENCIKGGLRIFPDSPVIDNTLDKIVESPCSLDVEKISVVDMHEDIRKIKNTIKVYGFFPISVIALQGFDAVGFPRELFSYNFDKGVVTKSPKLEDLENTLATLKDTTTVDMSPAYHKMLAEEYIGVVAGRMQSLKASITGYERQIDSLYAEMARKRDEEGILSHTELRDIIEEKNKLMAKRVDEFRKCVTKRESAYLEFVKLIKVNKPYREEGYAKILELKSKLVKELNEEISAVSSKLSDRKIEDKVLNKRLSQFKKNLTYSLQSDGFGIHPAVFYFQLKGDSVYKVNLFESLHFS